MFKERRSLIPLLLFFSGAAGHYPWSRLCPNHPQGLAFDKAGNLYAANFANNTIEKFTPDGIGSVFANTVSAARKDWHSTAQVFYMSQTG